MKSYILLTCEHGGAQIPRGYRKFFASAEAQRALVTHRGHDYGALTIAQRMAKNGRAPLVFAETSRLLVDLNRSIGNRHLHSEFLKKLSETDRRKIRRDHYLPYRKTVESKIRAAIQRGSRVLHLSIHSFTPNLNGVERTADIGLLYDPKTKYEKRVCELARKTFLQKSAAHPLRLKMNDPYRGFGDGLTSFLRTQFDSDQYCGIEVEFNHLLIFGISSTRGLYQSRRKLQPSDEVLRRVAVPVLQNLVDAFETI